VRLEAGDVICFPHGDPHVMSSERGLRAPPHDLSIYQRHPGARLPFSVKLGNGQVEVQVLCGFLGCDVRPFNPLLATLPRVLRASDRDGSPVGWLSRLMEVAEAEARSPRPGGEAVLARLSAAELGLFIAASALRSSAASCAAGALNTTLPLESTVLTSVNPAASNVSLSSGIFAFIGLTPRRNAA
jgi:hypothetical protein